MLLLLLINSGKYVKALHAASSLSPPLATYGHAQKHNTYQETHWGRPFGRPHLYLRAGLSDVPIYGTGHISRCPQSALVSLRMVRTYPQSSKKYACVHGDVGGESDGEDPLATGEGLTKAIDAEMDPLVCTEVLEACRHFRCSFRSSRWRVAYEPRRRARRDAAPLNLDQSLG